MKFALEEFLYPPPLPQISWAKTNHGDRSRFFSLLVDSVRPPSRGFVGDAQTMEEEQIRSANARGISPEAVSESPAIERYVGTKERPVNACGTSLKSVAESSVHMSDMALESGGECLFEARGISSESVVSPVNARGNSFELVEGKARPDAKPAVMEVFENQRWTPLRGFSDKLLPTDTRGQW